MSGCIRQRLGPTKKRLKERIEQTQTFLQQQITLDESESKNYFSSWREISNLTKIYWNNYKRHPKITKLKPNEWTVKWKSLIFSRLMVTTPFVILKYFWQIRLNENRRQPTEREERQRERAHQRELQTEKLQLDREHHLAKLNQEKELQIEKMKLELEMLKQNEIDKQPEHEQKILEVELEAKRKMTQTEKQMELKRTTVDIELKMKAEMEQKRLELEKQNYQAS